METIKDSPISGTLKGLYMETPHSDLDMTPEQFTDAVANYSFYTYSRANTSFAEGFNDLIARETHYHLEDRGYCFNGIFFKGLSTEDYEKAAELRNEELKLMEKVFIMPAILTLSKQKTAYEMIW